MKQRKKSVQQDITSVDHDIQTWNEMPDEQLAIANEFGWAPIHHAAQKGVIHIIKRAMDYNNQLIEQKTADVAAITPILAAVQAIDAHFSLYRRYHRHIMPLFYRIHTYIYLNQATWPIDMTERIKEMHNY